MSRSTLLPVPLRLGTLFPSLFDISSPLSSQKCYSIGFAWLVTVPVWTPVRVLLVPLPGPNFGFGVAVAFGKRERCKARCPVLPRCMGLIRLSQEFAR